MRELPTGTVTFLFTDIEGSTRLLDELGDGYAEALGEHRRLLREAFASHGGVEVDTQGDAFFYAFAKATEAVAAAQEGQAALASGPICVRMGLHTGEPIITGEGYAGIDVHTAARICSAGHGGQVLLSEQTALLVDGGQLLDLGRHRLKDLSAPERIYQLGDGKFPPLKTLYRTNLPVPATPFLGRERELAEVTELLSRDGVRLLTLTGPGGTGKTRLALQAAGEMAELYPDGVWWVPLAPLRDPELVLETAAQALEAKQELPEHIGDKQMFFLFDNFEQVIDAAAGLAELLERCPRLRLLVTSREPLHLDGEWEYAVDPLREAEAVELFCQRALAVKRDFSPAGEVQAICRRLDCLPLAIELASARVKALSPRAILERLEQRLPLLAGGARNLPERQRTLRATIEWSYDLLASEEQRLFARLGVFAGGWTLEAAEMVCDADLDTLQSLVDKSLVRRTDDRYWMLETIREFAVDRLEGSAEWEGVGERHAELFRDLVEEADAGIEGREAPIWLERVGNEMDNLRAALIWARNRPDAELLARLVIGCRWFWMRMGSLSEGRAWLEKALEHDLDVSLQVKVLGSLAYLCYLAGDYASSRAFGERELEAARMLDDPHALTGALANLGHVAEAEESFDEARRLYEEVIVRARAAGEARAIGVALLNLGDLEFRVGNYERAAELATETLPFCREAGDPAVIAAALFNAASADFRLGRVDEAFAEVAEAITDAADQIVVSYALELFAGIAAANANGRLAAQLLGAAEAVREESGYSLEPSEQTLHAEILATVSGMLGPDVLAGEWAAGKEMTQEHALAAALEMRPRA